jgi:hypothetical protein
MPRTLKYTTFRPGELEARLRELAPEAEWTLPVSIGAGNTSRLLKAHTFAVTYPDGQPGTCHYERGGPRWHTFRYAYGDGSSMPRQIVTERLANDLASIEAKGSALADACYREAIAVEQKHYFRRATEPSDGSRKKNPARYRMKAALAKQLAGKYALCRRYGESLLAVGPVRDTLEQANADWRLRKDQKLVVGCCSRLDRALQLPKFNPLYAECDPRPDRDGEPPKAV